MCAYVHVKAIEILQYVYCAPNDTSLSRPAERILYSRTFLRGREENIPLRANENCIPLINIGTSKYASVFRSCNFNEVNKQFLVIYIDVFYLLRYNAE
jgi:hypothetical protein